MPSGVRQGNVRAVRRFLVRGAAVVAFLAPGGAPAPVAAAAGSPAPAPVAERPMDAAAWDDHRLALAVTAWHEGRRQDARALLEAADVTLAAPSPHADRAAFLLAVLQQEAGEAGALADLARQAGDRASASAYRRWVAHLGLTAGAEPDLGKLPGDAAADLPASAVLMAALLLEHGHPDHALALLGERDAQAPLAAVHLHLRVAAADRAGTVAGDDLHRLASLAPATPRDADLVGAAALRLALEQLDGTTRGDAAAARAWLRRVPAGSNDAARAAHVLGLLALADGDTADGLGDLQRGLAGAGAPAVRRAILLEQGAVAAAGGDWSGALAAFDAADSLWQHERAALDALADHDSHARVWSIWRRDERPSAELRVDGADLAAALAAAVAAALDLRDAGTDPGARPAPRSAAPAPPADATPLGFSARTHQPTAAQWDTLRAAEGRHGQAAALLAHLDHGIDLRRRELDRRRRYLDSGHDETAATAGRLQAAVLRADSLLARLDAAAAALDTLRDRALFRFAARVRDLTTGLQRHLVFAAALHHFHAQGPTPPDQAALPAGVPSPDELLLRELELAQVIESFVARFAERTSTQVTRSCAEVWRPRLLGDTPRLRGELFGLQVRADADADSLARLLAGLDTDPALEDALAARADQAGRVDDLAAVVVTTGRQIAREVAARGQQALDDEHEAIAYHRADAAYWLAVALAADPAAADAPQPAADARDHALALLNRLLADHPGSAAGSETRFRLADLELLRAGDAFRARMAAFLGESPTGDQFQDRALAPFVDHGPAAALYAAILTDDPGFAHTDAVLFNLGMILADAGEPEGERLLERLVHEHPRTSRVQEAWLRLGDLRFARGDYGAALPCLTAAADLEHGGDPDLAAIARYKLGWSHLKQDAFLPAADAFGRLLDLATAGAAPGPRPGDGGADLAAEAEDHLVHALIRAGGAPAFATFIGSLGGRPWEARVLAAMGSALRGFSLHAEAVACDRLWLERYPDRPGALDAAVRLADTYARWNRPDAARAARLQTAPRFLDGSTWHAANADTALQARGRRFAQAAYRDAAEDRHRVARDGSDPAPWRETLDLYGTFLEHWPTDPSAARLHAQAGEAAARLDLYPVALRHFAAAAATSDSARDGRGFVADAAWQGVAVRDAWYRSTCAGTGGEGTVGADSLATALLADGDRFAAKHPDDPRVADLRWRQANLAYAHGWDEDAARRLLGFGNDHAADLRAAQGVRLAADAHTRRADFGAAARAYEWARDLALGAGNDSLAVALEATIPLTWYRLAESIAVADSLGGAADAAATFAKVARQWPAFPYANVALYRAGIGYAAAGDTPAAAAAWERLLADYPASPLGRDAAMQVARALEAGDPAAAAAAYERFAALQAGDADAPEALLRAADLRAAAGDTAGAERTRSAYLERFPADWETALAIRGERAAADLARVEAGTVTIGSLLGPGAALSELQAYLVLAAAHPGHGDARILAGAAFHQAEAALADYRDLALGQPLSPAIARKQAALDGALTLYRRCLDHGDLERSRAAAHRIGEAIVHFGDALLSSERPADLAGDDLQAYQDVLADQAWVFQERGEAAWNDLLRQTRGAAADPGGWLERTREVLWPRLARRFLHRPEVEYPRLEAPPAPAPILVPIAAAGAEEPARTLP